jgi:hypothetical protein
MAQLYLIYLLKKVILHSFLYVYQNVPPSVVSHTTLENHGDFHRDVFQK